MADEDFLRNVVSTDDDGDEKYEDAVEQDGDSEDGIGAEYGDEEDDDKPEGYEFEKEDGSDDDDNSQKPLDLEEKGGKGGIFDKNESDSDVEEYLEGLENDEIEMDGLKLPSDAEEDDNDDDTDEPGFEDYDDEDDIMEGVRDDYEDSDEGKPNGKGKGKPEEEDDE
jgi:hypothetical protein